MTPTLVAIFVAIASLGAAQQQGQGQQAQGQQQGQAQQGQGRQGQGQQGQGRQGQGAQGQAGQQGQQLTQTISIRSGIRIATPTYFQDGKTGGASASRTLSGPTPQAESFTVYPHAGKTLCESSSAAGEMPATAGFGWRVTIMPRGLDTTVTPRGLNTSSVAVNVTWQRLWNNGQKVSEPGHGPVSLNLSAGSRVVLDYLSATPTAQCSAVGMALEIGLDAGPSPSLLQADLWLIYQPEHEPARSQRQRVRVGADGAARYYFDDVALNPRLTARISGTLSKVEARDGEVSMDVTITQAAGAGNGVGGSTTYPIKVKLGDTISFKLPLPDAFYFFNSNSAPVELRGADLSLRIRAEQIR